jgi:orotidine-5'-phosphate decarboxylase
MTRDRLIRQIRNKRSFLCVGLDTDPARIPDVLQGAADPVFEFNKAVVDATRDLCVAYKPNIAFYEALGPDGWKSLEKTMDYIGDGHLTIADAKRGDIGNSSEKYAETFFRQFDFDAVTVSPYMGRDSVTPFLAYENKWAVILALTSNQGAADFQLAGTPPLYETVLRQSKGWGTDADTMFVVGATRPEAFTAIRRIVPSHFLLVPGVGAQGGDLEALAAAGMNSDIGLIVNASRSILYASAGTGFAEKARQEAVRLQAVMARIMDKAESGREG